ncbi:MAG: hypothetical protein AseanaTS_15210 [Candidatus Pelagadaptatus aseana]|uniref:chalcone isomerase family protein n=1 Tax=Candidatus Pelagadaptatus aseana TaxID=3120508 RepID=UPI0039B303FE
MVKIGSLILVSFLTISTAYATSWQTIGQSTLTFWRWDIYTATLYNDQGQYQGIESPLKLSLNYHRNIPAKRIYKETRKQFKRLGYQSSEHDLWLDAFYRALPDIESGATLSFELKSDNSAVLHHNNTPVNHFAASALNRHFLEIWLSEATQEPDMRKQLIKAN